MSDLTEMEQRMRKALAAGPTPGPWHHCQPFQSVRAERTLHGTVPAQRVDFVSTKTQPVHERIIIPMAGKEAHVRSEDMAFIAACNPENIAALLAEIDRLRAATSRPRDAGDPTYPDAERCAQTMERCEEDLLTEAQFVRWQGQEIDRLRELLARKVVDSTVISELTLRNGSLNARYEGGACAILADAFADQIYEVGAENYVEVSFRSAKRPELGLLVVTVQRQDGKTPHQLRVSAEAERDALRAACKTTLMLRQLGGMMPGTKAVIDVAIHHAEEALAQIEQERSEQAKERT